MKRFIRSIAGKFLLFAVCVLSVCVLCVCVLGAAAALSGGGRFYTQPEEQIREEVLGGQIRQRIYFGVWEAVNGDPAPEENKAIPFEVYSAEGGKLTLLFRSAGVTERTAWEYTFYYAKEQSPDDEAVYLYSIDEPQPSAGVT